MAQDLSLLEQVKAFVRSDRASVRVVTAEWIATLGAAAEEFQLGPDEWIDVKRLPKTVKNFPDLLAYLRTIQTELARATDETKSSGRLRQYKLFVCCIHALHNYLLTVPAYGIQLSVFVTAVMEHAKANVPVSLSDKGKKLWTATFQSSSGRTRSCMMVLIKFMHEQSTPHLDSDGEDDEEGKEEGKEEAKEEEGAEM